MEPVPSALPRDPKDVKDEIGQWKNLLDATQDSDERDEIQRAILRLEALLPAKPITTKNVWMKFVDWSASAKVQRLLTPENKQAPFKPPVEKEFTKLSHDDDLDRENNDGAFVPQENLESFVAQLDTRAKSIGNLQNVVPQREIFQWLKDVRTWARSVWEYFGVDTAIMPKLEGWSRMIIPVISAAEAAIEMQRKQGKEVDSVFLDQLRVYREVSERLRRMLGKESVQEKGAAQHSLRREHERTGYTFSPKNQTATNILFNRDAEGEYEKTVLSPDQR